MIRRIRNWLKRREIDDAIGYAATQLTLNRAYRGDPRRADRLRAVIAKLEAEKAELV